eukprot:scaffold10711_cov73-Cyclotella_meneghiniana.AAC.2
MCGGHDCSSPLWQWLIYPSHFNHGLYLYDQKCRYSSRLKSITALPSPLSSRTTQQQPIQTVSFGAKNLSMCITLLKDPNSLSLI